MLHTKTGYNNLRKSLHSSYITVTFDITLGDIVQGTAILTASYQEASDVGYTSDEFLGRRDILYVQQGPHRKIAT